MKRLFKIVFVLLIVFIMTGCTAEFKINVGETISEELILKADTESEYKTFIENQKNYPINKYYNDKNVEAYVTGYQNNVSYYDFQSNDDDFSLNYKSTFSISKASTSNIVNKCFEKYELVESKDELYISAENFQCLKNGLNVAKVTLVTDYNILYSNADSQDSNELMWYINSSNYENKSLKVNLYKKVNDTSESNKTIDNENKDNSDNNDDDTNESDNEKETNYTMILVYILLGTLVLIGVFLILFQKKSNNNRI